MHATCHNETEEYAILHRFRYVCNISGITDASAEKSCVAKFQACKFNFAESRFQHLVLQFSLQYVVTSQRSKIQITFFGF
jgi:hypothetical protein